MATVRGQRLRMLELRNAGISQLAAWVEQNRTMFKGPVFGPLACEVAVADLAHAAYLEQQCQCARSPRRTAARSLLISPRMRTLRLLWWMNWQYALECGVCRKLQACQCQVCHPLSRMNGPAQVLCYEVTPSGALQGDCERAV